MRTATTTIDRMNGQLFVVNSDSDNGEPILRKLWWPVTRTGGWLPCWFDADSSGEYCKSCGQRHDSVGHAITPQTLHVSGYDGRYGGQLSNGTRYTVEIDPRGQAVKIESIAIPCPKVRKGIETRFYRGEWQKYTKSAGWSSISV
jgi:hypothetical protein